MVSPGVCLDAVLEMASSFSGDADGNLTEEEREQLWSLTDQVTPHRPITVNWCNQFGGTTCKKVTSGVAKAVAASVKANKASIKADDTMLQKDYAEGAKLHAVAATLHKAEAVKAKSSNDTSLSTKHEKIASDHVKAAQFLDKYRQKLVSKTKGKYDAVKAKRTKTTNANPEGHNQYTHAVGAKVEQHGAGVGEVVSVDKNGKTGTVQVGKYTLKKEKLPDWRPHDPENSIYTKTRSTAPKSATTQPSLPRDGGKTTDHAKHVEDAVIKHGGQMVPMVKVRKHLSDQGITDRGYQDAAIEHARGGSVTGSNLEGRHGISESEHAAALHSGEDRIGYLSLRE